MVAQDGIADVLGVVALVLVDVLGSKPRRILIRRGLNTNPSIGPCKMMVKVKEEA